MAEPKVETGVYGFCGECGNPVMVEVGERDRLQSRLVRAYAIRQAAAKGLTTDAEAQLRHALTTVATNASVAQALANYGNQDWRSTRMELLRRMREAMAGLVVAESALALLLNQPVDLLREATEELERETELLRREDA